MNANSSVMEANRYRSFKERKGEDADKFIKRVEITTLKGKRDNIAFMVIIGELSFKRRGM